MISIIWFFIIFLFVMSLVGVILPFLPDTLLLWIGLLLYRFTLSEGALPFSFWFGMILITILIISSDIITNIFFVRKYGGSKWSVIGAGLGVVIGSIIFGPIGLILGPLLTVFLITLIESEDSNKAIKIALGTIFAFFSSSFVKLVMQLIMIGWFFLSI